MEHLRKIEAYTRRIVILARALPDTHEIIPIVPFNEVMIVDTRDNIGKKWRLKDFMTLEIDYIIDEVSK